ncbi:MAG: response regulator [bacterium]
MNEKHKILIVEDDNGISSALKEKLEHEKFSITTAKNGEEGLVRIKEINPDLILLDLAMPRMDGVTMLENMKTTGLNVPVIVLTNLDDKCDADGAIKNGAKECLVKAEWKLEDIVEKIKFYLR